jgi:ABC-type dipeptide/oligopeptide/nickel transport system permease subunit
MKPTLGALLGFAWMIAALVIAIGAPLIAPLDPLQPVGLPLSPGDPSSILGTDALGRDLWSRFVFGARTSMTLALLSGGLTITIGIFVGMIAAIAPFSIDRFITWASNAMLAIPGLLLAMLFVAGLGPGVSTVIFAVGLGGIPGFVRISRTIFKQIRSQNYIQAARAMGAGTAWIAWFHILPNAITRLFSLATLHFAWAFLGTTTLTFLGFAGDPSIPEWGAMLNSGRLHLNDAPYLAILPGAAISLTILAIHTIGSLLSVRSQIRSQG